MDGVTLASLAVELLAAIHSLSSYPRAAPPEIHPMPVAEIHRRFCNAPCRVQAYYLPDEGIYIDEKLDPLHDVFARSILLHELVHHLQKANGRFLRIPSECDRWFAAEQEAYEIQNHYLESVHSPHRVHLNPWQLLCSG